MGYCSWEELVSETVLLGDNLYSGYLLERVAVIYGTIHPGEYPREFSSELEIELKETTKNLVFCSNDRPTVIYEGSPITSLNIVQPYGYELSSAITYVRACHGLMNYPDDGSVDYLLKLGYSQNGGKEFQNLDQIVGEAVADSQSDQRKVGHFFRVFGVASNDVLNVRVLPNAVSPIVAILLPDTPLLEVFSVSDDGKWFEVNAEEGTGWIRNKFVEELEVSVFPETNVPDQLSCFASEPFIDAQFDKTVLSFTGLDKPREISLLQAQVLRSSPAEVTMTGAETGEQIVISNQICNDEAGRKYPYTMASSYYRPLSLYFCCTLR